MISLGRNSLLLIGTSIAIGSGAAIADKFFWQSIDSLLPDTTRITSFSRPGTITLLSTKGKIIQKLGPATREKVELGKMPELIQKAFIAAEDRRFVQHQGVDLWGVSRAIVTNIRQRAVREGGSTITQQLARTVFLSQDKTLARKLREASLAYKIERELSKEEILTQYLNNVYLGSGAYGIADASWVYFSKTPESLMLEEIALIAGMPPAPSLYSPLVSPDLALKRRSIVLERMRKERFISEEQFSTALSMPLNLKPATPKYLNSAAPFFTSWAAKQLPLHLTPEQLEVGGLTIRTSLNLNWQQTAQQVIQKYSPEKMEGAIVSIQPNTGLVRVLVGGKDFATNQFNRATQALRSPGSTFKLFPYAAAINAGKQPEDLYIDKPRCWYGYCPKNFGNKYMGKVSIAEAFKNSLNTVAVQILDEIGFDKVISTAQKLGIGKNRKLGKYYPLAIGAYEQTVLDMTAAYAGVANQGVFMTPHPFEEIRGPDNELLWSHKVDSPRGQRALKAKTATIINWMLQRAVSDGTGIAAALEERPVAGKTGTSEGGRDLWFIGSIPQLTTGIWFGYDNNQRTNQGSGQAAWAWKKFMSNITNELKVLEFKRPPNNKIKPTPKD